MNVLLTNNEFITLCRNVRYPSPRLQKPNTSKIYSSKYYCFQSSFRKYFCTKKMGQMNSKCLLIKSTLIRHIEKKNWLRRVTFMNSLFSTRVKYFHDWGKVLLMKRVNFFFFYIFMLFKRMMKLNRYLINMHSCRGQHIGQNDCI